MTPAELRAALERETSPEVLGEIEAALRRAGGLAITYLRAPEQLTVVGDGDALDKVLADARALDKRVESQQAKRRESAAIAEGLVSVALKVALKALLA